MKKVTIITAQGVKSYEVGEHLRNGIIDVIKSSSLYFNGDPFDHYCGYDASGKMLFSINCLVPCEVEYV